MGATFIIHNKISDTQGAPLVVKNLSFIARVNPQKIDVYSFFFFLGNRMHFLSVCRRNDLLEMFREHSEKFVVFSQHPAWVIEPANR